MRHFKPLPYLTCVLLVIAFIGVTGENAAAQCYGALGLAPTYFEYDFLVRLAVHFGDESSLPADIICGRERMSGEELVEVPIFVYNAHEGVTWLGFTVESNDSMVNFTPQSGFSLYHLSFDKVGDIYGMNVKLISGMPVCGPALAGYAYVMPGETSEVTWINLVPNHITGNMSAIDASSNEHYMFSPSHGGFIGPGYLYTCQEPICEEPNGGVTDLVAVRSYGYSVRITLTAGEGTHTIICARVDRYPKGYNDGRLVVDMETVPGNGYSFFDTSTIPNTITYYKAFSVTKNAMEEVINNSFVECSAVDTVFIDGQIGVEPSTWSGIKKTAR